MVLTVLHVIRVLHCAPRAPGGWVWEGGHEKQPRLKKYPCVLVVIYAFQHNQRQFEYIEYGDTSMSQKCLTS